MQNKHLLGKDRGDGSLANRCLGTEIIQAVTSDCVIWGKLWNGVSRCLLTSTFLSSHLWVPLKLWVFHIGAIIVELVSFIVSSQHSRVPNFLLPARLLVQLSPHDILVRRSPGSVVRLPVLQADHHHSSSCVLVSRSGHLFGPQFPRG